MHIRVPMAMALFLGMAGMADAAENSSEKNVLIAYFSWSGNTRFIAEKLSEKVGGDLFEIVSVNPYPAGYRACVDQAEEELKKQLRPSLTSHVEDMGRYDVLLLGYPNWCSSIPMPVASFLEEYDFSGKTIVPFCSHGGGGLAQTVSAIIEKLCPDSNILEALVVYSKGGKNLERDMDAWLNDNEVETKK